MRRHSSSLVAIVRESTCLAEGDIIYRGGQYSLVNNVWGDTIHRGTQFTPTLTTVLLQTANTLNSIYMYSRSAHAPICYIKLYQSSSQVYMH